MSARHLLGVRQDKAGRIAPVFAAADEIMDPLAHHRAVVGYLRKGRFAPASFAAGAQTPADIAARLAARKPAAAAAIAAQATHVELGVRIICAAAPDAAAPNGQSYLRRAAAKLHGQDAALAIVARIEAIAGADAMRRLASETGAIALAVKAPRADARRVASAIEALAAPGVTLDVSGPWPLYSFGLAEVLS